MAVNVTKLKKKIQKDFQNCIHIGSIASPSEQCGPANLIPVGMTDIKCKAILFFVRKFVFKGTIAIIAS